MFLPQDMSSWVSSPLSYNLGRCLLIPSGLKWKLHLLNFLLKPFMSLIGKKDVNNSSQVILFKNALWDPAALLFLLGLRCGPSEGLGARFAPVL